MTTVEEELEQSTEDIVSATEDSLQNQNKILSCVADTKIVTVPDSQNNPRPLNISTCNSKERQGYDKNTANIQSSKDGSNLNNQSKSHSTLKTSTNGETQTTIMSTISSSTNVSLQPLRYTSVQTSNIHIQNPSSGSPTVQSITTSQVAGTTVATIHEIGQVCNSFILHILELFGKWHRSIMHRVHTMRHIIYE